ncbi:hypothetical protein [Cellulomonas sp. ATA003]|uniref:hypothetical protein n=1 Tax=Cellulomonas sp. ATA003 TaxID=3073064 RepID=UPI002873B128|nr:hypothetical protein [Cellulomonas sp. ATA003]WNB84353.1 hypothetical protein REH70_10710 [Cellulomonas sp. ATA003]
MHEVEPVSAGIRRVGGQVRAEHHTVGVVRTLPGDVNELDCACGVTLTNGPGWSLDEHLRLHRAEVKYEALVAVAHPGMPLSRTTGRSPPRVRWTPSSPATPRPPGGRSPRPTTTPATGCAPRRTTWCR